MTLDIIKNKIVEKKEITSSIISERQPNQIKFEISGNIHEFTIIEDKTTWSVWEDHFCNEQGSFTDDEILEEISFIC